MNARVLLALASLCSGPVPLAFANTADREWRFEVFLDDKPIGYHHFRLSSGGGTQHLRSEASFRVKVLGLTLYTYVHRSLELWQDNCLQRIDASTDDNGSDFRVSGVRSGEQLLVESRSGTTGLAGCVVTFAYWNPAILRQQHLLNVQTGEYLPVRVDRLGKASLQVGGHPVPAVHYRIATGEGDIEIWYSRDDDWLGLRSSTRGGRELRYRRIPPAVKARSTADD